MRHRLLLQLAIVASFTVGCQSTTRDRTTTTPRETTNPSQNDKPIAYIDGTQATRDQLYTILVEAHGGEALSELILDRAVAKRLSEAGITLTQQDLDHEQQRLRADLATDADDGQRLINQMRARLGLGETRYQALLRRNAGMRKLVQDDLAVAEPAIRQAYELRYGPRYQARLITANDVNTLSRTRRDVLAGASFTDLATRRSTDASAAQGGLLSPISPADATYPQAVREALARLSMDDSASRLSPVIALADGYALLWLEDVTEADGPPLEEVREELARSVRRDLERVRMRQLARSLIEAANIVILDPALDKSWQQRKESIQNPR